MGLSIRRQIIEGSTNVLTARVKDIEGIDMTIAAVESISVRVTDMNSLDETGEFTAEPADTILDVLRTDRGWQEADAIDGYNFALVLDGQYVPDGNTVYQVVVTITPSDDSQAEIKLIPWELETTQLLGE